MKKWKGYILKIVMLLAVLGFACGAGRTVYAYDEKVTPDGFQYYEVYDEGEHRIVISAYSGTGGDIVVPSVIDGVPVTSIGNYAFSVSVKSYAL